MADTCIHKFLIYAKPEQRAVVEKLHLHTLRDLFNAVWIPTDRLPTQHNRIVVFKGRLLSFLNQQCLKTFVDFEAMRRARLIEFGGQYPNQFVSLVQAAAPQPRPRSLVSQPPKHVTINGGWSEEVALAKALEESARMSKPPPPPELCCPITLELFSDPVQTIHGMTYERSAIVEWLKKHDTDPLSNEPLRVKAVWPDEDMRKRVIEFLR
jgi:hypothetical protein